MQQAQEKMKVYEEVFDIVRLLDENSIGKIKKQDVNDNDISMLPDAMVQTEDTDTTADATEGKTVTVTGATEQPAAAAEDRNAGEESEPVAVDAATDIEADKAGSADIFDKKRYI